MKGKGKPCLKEREAGLGVLAPVTVGEGGQACRSLAIRRRRERGALNQGHVIALYCLRHSCLHDLRVPMIRGFLDVPL